MGAARDDRKAGAGGRDFDDRHGVTPCYGAHGLDEQLYDAHEKLDDTFWWFVGRRQVIRQVMKKHLPDVAHRRRIVDVGCGAGGNLLMLREFGEVTGIDANERILVGARARVGHEVTLIHGEFPQCLPAQTRFDVVCAFDVIEHLDDPIGALRGARERLDAGGRLVVTVPAFPFLWSVHDDLNHHRRRYLRSTLLEQLAQAGFATDWVSYFNSVLFPAIAAVRVVRNALRFAESQSDAVRPAAPVNALLTRMFAAEGRVVPNVPVPFGVSLIAVARPV